MNLFVKGKPAVVTIDDFLPFYYGQPNFAKRSSDGDFWMPFLEKAFAKLMGNYESIGGGWQAETWRMLNGAPTRFYTMASVNNDGNQAWTIIQSALA
jgi:Calpain family cysteine protease